MVTSPMNTADNGFDEIFQKQFWDYVPKKVGREICKAKVALITSKGLKVSTKGVKLAHNASLDDLGLAAKAWNQQTVNDDVEKKFMPNPETWLDQGRFKDYDESERDKLVAQYDKLQEWIAEHKRKKARVVERGLRVV